MEAKGRSVKKHMTLAQHEYSTDDQTNQVISFGIDPEFADKIPKMSQKDFEGLRDDILRDGFVRDPLVVWQEENILLDGHNRWKIIQDNLDKLDGKYSIVYMSFPDRWAAIAWICANQLHKHNMNKAQRDKLIQEEHDARQKSWGGSRGNQYTVPSGKNNHLPNDDPEIVRNGKPGKQNTTRPTIAKEHGITEGAVRTAVEVGRGIDKAEKVVPGFKDKVLSGEVKAKNSELAKMRNMDDEEIKAAVDNIINPPKDEQKKDRLGRKNVGFSKADREMKNLIEAAITAQLDVDRDPNYTVENLVEEVEVNGHTYINSLRTTLMMRKELLKDANAKVRVFKAIAGIVQDIVKVRGEFEK